MSPAEAEALGRRWIAAGGGWHTGMRSIDGWRILAIDMVIVCATDGSSNSADGVEVRECSAGLLAVPDLRDAATRGAALEVVREQWGAPALQISPVVRTAADGCPTGEIVKWRYHVNDPDEHCGDAPTEAEALVAALEAAPKEGA